MLLDRKEPNKERIKKLIKALRSNIYQEGSIGRLKSIKGCYCPLGVACEVSGLGRFVSYDAYKYEYLVHNKPTGHGATGRLPLEVSKWYGLDPSPTINGHPITYYNDIARLNFKQIASLIEKEFLL